MTIKPIYRLTVLNLTLCLSTIINSSELGNTEINNNAINQLVTEITETMHTYYVSEETASDIIAVIKKNHDAGLYNSILDPNKLAMKLQSDLKSINNDIHLNISFVAKTPDQLGAKQVKNSQVSKYGIWTNYGIQELKILEGNVGYMKINHFGRWTFHKKHREAITAAINFLQHSDVLILDVRENQGGYEDIVAYLISYFFSGEAVHLSDYYTRFDDKTTSLYTKTDIPGPRMSDVPIYILTSGNTTSAGESLAYMMKHLNKATIIGEKTAGAGHGATYFPLSSGFSITVSSEITINAVTKSSLEAVGVQPDIEIEASDALDHAYSIALDHLMNNNTRNISAENYDRIKLLLPPKQVTGNLPLENYVGKYISEGIEINITAGNDKLWAQIKGKGTIELIANGNHVFVVKMANERVKFVVTTDQQVSGLIGLDSPMDLKRIVTDK